MVSSVGKGRRLDADQREVTAMIIRSRHLTVPLAVGLWQLAAAAPEIRNEALLVDSPPGYKIGFQAQQQDRSRITEMVPTGETVESWTEMVTVQTFPGLTATPEQFES